VKSPTRPTAIGFHFSDFIRIRSGLHSLNDFVLGIVYLGAPFKVIHTSLYSLGIIFYSLFQELSKLKSPISNAVEYLSSTLKATSS
jgi:hypothetical protein